MHFPTHVLLAQICHQEKTCLRNTAPGSLFSSISRNPETKQPLPCSAPPAVTRPVQGYKVLPSPGFSPCIGQRLSAAQLSAPSNPSFPRIHYGALELGLSWTWGHRTSRHDAKQSNTSSSNILSKGSFEKHLGKTNATVSFPGAHKKTVGGPGCAWGPIPIAMH